MSCIIASLQNRRVKQAIRLRGGRGRQKQQRIIIDGVRELRCAVESGVALSEVFICPATCEGDEVRALIERLTAAGAELLEVAPAVMAKLAYGRRSEGLVAVAATPQRRLEQLELKADALVTVIQSVEKPGNVGAVARSAEAAGVDALIVVDQGTDLYNPNAIRASLGAIFTLQACCAGTAETLAWLRSRGAKIFTARVDGALDYAAADYRGAAAIVLGGESIGLSEVWQGEDVTEIQLPMLGSVDSLNVSAAAAVLFYTALEQRRR